MAWLTRCLRRACGLVGQDDRLRHGWLRLLEDCTSLEAGDSGPLSAVQRERDAGAAGGGRMEGSTDDAELMTRQGSGGRRAESESEGGQGRAPLWRRECELVERGAFLISTIEAPELEQEALSRQLDDIAGKVRARMRTRLEREGADPDSALEVDEILKDLNFVLFEDGGFHGNEQDYYDPKNSYLHQVLARKTGIPISLSVLYMCVAARLGIKMVGVNAPGHFLLRCYAGPASKVRMLYIDVFNSGHCLDSAALHVMLHRLGVREDRWEERLPTTRPRDLFARMLRNLVVAHRPPDDLRWEQLRAVAESVGGSLAATGLTSAAALLEKRVSECRCSGCANCGEAGAEESRQSFSCWCCASLLLSVSPALALTLTLTALDLRHFAAVGPPGALFGAAVYSAFEVRGRICTAL